MVLRDVHKAAQGRSAPLARIARRMDRSITRLALVIVLVAALVAGTFGCAQTHRRSSASKSPAVAGRTAPAVRSHPAPLRIVPSHPGVAHVILHGKYTHEIALTFD